MSTAGKVLTVLILLVMCVWLVIISGVSKLNATYGQKINAQQKQLDKLAIDVAKANNDIQSITEQARVEQDATGRDDRLLQIKIDSAERRKSIKIEFLTRLKAEVADYLVAVERATKNLTTREAEKAKGIDDVAKKKDEVAKAQGRNAELRTELAQLQEDFKRLLAGNSESIDKARQKSLAKPASNVRVSPSS